MPPEVHMPRPDYPWAHVNGQVWAKKGQMPGFVIKYPISRILLISTEKMSFPVCHVA